MNLADLPNIAFCETATDKVEQSVLTLYEGIAKKTLFPGDPVRLFLESLAAVIVQQRQVIDYTGKQNLLGLSEDDFLDHLGAFTKTPRLEATPAITTIRLETDEIHGYAIPIEDGVQVSPDGQLWFVLMNYAELAAGDLFVDVEAMCYETGEVGNGFLPGQVTKMDREIDGIISITNVTESTGGAGREGNESYRQRIHSRPESFSTAGPTGAYDHWARSAHQDISDVAVFQTSPLDELTESQLDTVLAVASIDGGEMGVEEKRLAIARWLSPSTVKVVPLCKGGEVPSIEVLEKVEEDLSPHDVRPLTDVVEVAAPVAAPCAIDCSYYIALENRTNRAAIQAAVEKAFATYQAWQCEKLGRDINPSKMIQMLMDAGASRVTVISPIFTPVARDAVPSVTNAALNYGGFDE